MSVIRAVSDTGRIYRYLLVITFLLSASIITFAVRVGVDPYHEGALFPSAVGVAQGLHIFSEVNNQYGFMYAFFQAPFLYLFGNYLIVTRIIGALIVLVSAGFCFLMVSKLWGRKIGLFTALICVGINPSWSYLSHQNLNGFGAWINQYGVFLVITSTFMVLSELDRPKSRKYLILIAGGISLLSTFVRLEFALVWVIQTIFLFSAFRRGLLSRKNFEFWTIGGSLVGILSITYLVSIGSFPDFLNQLVFVWFDSPPNSAHLGFGNLFTFVTSVSLFIFNLGAVHLLSRFRKSWIWIVTFMTITLILISKSLEAASGITFAGKLLGPYLLTALDGYFLNFSSVLVLLLITFTLLSFRRVSKSYTLSTLFLQLTSIGLLAQLHNVNSAYIFMFNPILISWFMYWLHNHKIRYSKFLISLKNTMISMVVFSLLLGLSLEFKPSYSFHSPILAGMADYSVETRDSIDRKFELLDKYTGVGEVYFDCPNGLFAVSQNGLYAADKWTWNEIPKAWVIQSLAQSSKGDFLLQCGGGVEEISRYEEMLKNKKIRVLGELPNFNLYQFE